MMFKKQTNLYGSLNQILFDSPTDKYFESWRLA